MNLRLPEPSLRLLALAVIFLLSLGLRWWMLSGSELLPGPDGGYYAVGVGNC